MNIATIIKELEDFAPLAYQESYDNSGLLTGNSQWECTGALCTLDVTEQVIEEAINKGCNLVIAHHPIIFSGLKKITGKTYVERTIIKAIKNDIALYAIHTNADNVLNGVNNTIAIKVGLRKTKILVPKVNILAKLITFIPLDFVARVKEALFNAGAGNIGNYSEASFGVEGIGTYKANKDANPFLGEIGVTHAENELKLEVIFPLHKQSQILKSLFKAHPYEEVAYDIIPLNNEHHQVGSGLIGSLLKPINEVEFLNNLKDTFGLKAIKHTPLLNKAISQVAVCGGSGSFLIKQAIAAGADVFITSDIKYHEFFDAENKIIILDIGHWESEQFTIDLLVDIIRSKFPTFAVLKSEVVTNPVQYFL